MGADLLDFGESATGTFYNTRYQTDDECPRGDFNWHLNGNTVRGSWVCYDHLSGGDWTLDRIIPQDRPSESECFTINDSANRNALHGAWDYDLVMLMMMMIGIFVLMVMFGLLVMVN